MLTHDAVTIAQASQSLGVGSRRLFQLLRERGVLSENNIAAREYVDRGYFRNEHRSHYLRGTHIQRWYTVPMVTGSGMALLQELIDGMDPPRQVVVAEQRRVPNQRSAGAGSAALQQLGSSNRTARRVDLPARDPERHRGQADL